MNSKRIKHSLTVKISPMYKKHYVKQIIQSIEWDVVQSTTTENNHSKCRDRLKAVKIICD